MVGVRLPFAGLDGWSAAALIALVVAVGSLCIWLAWSSGKAGPPIVPLQPPGPASQPLHPPPGPLPPGPIPVPGGLVPLHPPPPQPPGPIPVRPVPPLMPVTVGGPICPLDVSTVVSDDGGGQAVCRLAPGVSAAYNPATREIGPAAKWALLTLAARYPGSVDWAPDGGGSIVFGPGDGPTGPDTFTWSRANY